MNINTKTKNTFFNFKIFYNQFIIFSSKLNKQKTIFSILYNFFNSFVSKRSFKKSLTRSPHVDKKSQEKFIQTKVIHSFFLNAKKYKELRFKNNLIEHWFSTFLHKKSKVYKYYVFYKKF
jgi:hypothetical protein